MSDVSQETWSRLERDRPDGDHYRARLAYPQTSSSLLAALDANGDRHFLVAVDGGQIDLGDVNIRGIGLCVHQMAIPGQGLKWYLDLECRDPSGYEGFDTIGFEIARRLASRLERPEDVVFRVLSKWRRFWGEELKQLLSREEQIGLLCELHFLRSWLGHFLPPLEAVQRWRGPLGARHDFEWSSGGVEAKATTSTRGAIHHINGVDQLAAPQDGRLYLFSLQLREESSASVTLASLVDECRTFFSLDVAAASILDERLAKARYSPVFEVEYSRTKYRLVEQGLFVVNDRFPRIIRASFLDGLPSGVETLGYDINLANCDDLCLARTPSRETIAGL